MQINTREYQSIHNITEELTLQENKNYLFSLTYLSALSVTGQNPEQYLQGQLTCDITKVTKQNMQPGALCNLQGRIISLLNAIVWNDNHYLILPKDLQEKVQKILHKTAIFSKAKIEKEDNFAIFGFYLQNSEDIIPYPLPEEQYACISDETHCCYNIAENLYLIIVKEEESNKLLNTFPIQQLRKDFAWHSLLIKSSIYEIYPTSSALFLPHRLNLQKTAYLSFNKGCFIGQEIIARTQYLAKLKHGMYLYEICSEEQLYPGQKIYTEDTKQEIGELIDFTISNKNQYLIACSLLLEHPTQVKFAEHKNLINLSQQ